MNGHGAHFWHIHHQMMARYHLERLSNDLGPIKELDYFYEHIETPYKPSISHFNGLEFPDRSEHLYITARHHNYELIKMVRNLERRILDAIDTGYVMSIHPGSFMNLYSSEGYNLLGELIEGTGRSINPRYYGSFHMAAKKLLGDAPFYRNIEEYAPSVLEMSMTAIRDPVFWQLYQKIMEFFHFYSLALPPYQYNDIIMEGVKIDKVEVSELKTLFEDFEVNINNHFSFMPNTPQSESILTAHVNRLNHQPWKYAIHVDSEKYYKNSVVRAFIGPKFDYDGTVVDINEDRHLFFEIDQFAYDR